MKVSFRQDPEREEPEIVITASELTPQIKELMDQLSSLQVGPVAAFHEGRAVLVHPENILRFYTDGKGVSIQTDRGSFSVNQRLYQWEEMLDKKMFVRVSNSEIVNLRHVTDIDLSLSGTIRMILDGSTVVYVSRRYMKKIKEAVGI